MVNMHGEGFRRPFAKIFSCVLALAAAGLLLSGCAKKKSARIPAPPVIGSVERGLASWYGYPYHGRRSANGEIYDMEKLIAAHRTLPFETWVEVTNLSNRKQVQVRITDRGPFKRGRIIDLSRAAARQIDMIGPGVVKVSVKVIAPPEPPPEPPPEQPPAAVLYAVQVGAFENRDNAERLVARLKERYPLCRITPSGNSPPVWRVLVGEERAREAAEALQRELQDETGGAFVVLLDAPASNGI
jgi:rare lipoprotein A